MNFRISAAARSVVSGITQANSQTTLFAVGDDWQAIYRFSGAKMSLTTAFHENFGEGDRCDLDTTYRFNSRIGEVANRFIQQNLCQLKKPLNSLTNGDKKPSRYWMRAILTLCWISSLVMPNRKSAF